MSISDKIVVMKDGVLMQQGVPQQVYDDPQNLFVAKFLGTPPINVFEGQVRNGQLLLDGQPVLSVSGAPDGEVFVGIRPEGFEPTPQGPVACALDRVEVLGRDTSIVCSHPSCQTSTLRAIIRSEQLVGISEKEVRFTLVPEKVFLFHREREERVPFTLPSRA